MTQLLVQIRDAAAVGLVASFVLGACGLTDDSMTIGTVAAFAGCLIGRWIG